MSDYVLGIDLGTTTTIASIIMDGIPQVVNVDSGKTSKLFPSVVSFNPDDNKKRVAGHAAKKLKSVYPELTIYSIKRVIGKKFSQDDTLKAIKSFPFKVVEAFNDSIAVDVSGTMYSPQEISSFIISEVKNAAEKLTGKVIDKTVITVPANFNEMQRRATRIAGKHAGLDVLKIINEPTAAALAYGFGKQIKKIIAVYDFGGGTFDITILEVRNDFFEVRSTEGESFLGGDDIDRAFADYLAGKIKREWNVEVKDNKLLYQNLLVECEKVKMHLSSKRSFEFFFRWEIDGKIKNFSFVIDRNIFEKIAIPIISKTFKIVTRALRSAHLKASEVEDVILVGGTTKIPILQKKVETFFGKTPIFWKENELVVSMGAAIYGQSLFTPVEEHAPVLLDVSPMSLGAATIGDHIEIIIEKNEPLPVERTKIFTNAQDDQENVKIEIFQGDSDRKSESLFIGELTLNNLPAAKRGDFKIEIKFEIDTDGVLNVRAKDLKTGLKRSIELNILGLG